MSEITRKQLEKLFSKEYLDSVPHEEAVARYLRKVEGMDVETKKALGLIATSKEHKQAEETTEVPTPPAAPKKK